MHYPAVLNCAAELLDRAAQDRHEAIAIRSVEAHWSYGRLRATVNQLCRVLTEDLGIVPGNRVLLRAANSPMMIAAWLAVAKAGAVIVATMPMLRAKELQAIVEKARSALRCVRFPSPSSWKRCPATVPRHDLQIRDRAHSLWRW